MLQFWKRDIQEPLDLDLQGSHLVNQTLPLTGKIPKIRNQRRGRPLNQGVSIGHKKLGNDNRILLVRLGLPELHLHVIGNEQRVDEKDPVTPINIEGTQWSLSRDHQTCNPKLITLPPCHFVPLSLSNGKVPLL